MSDRVFGNVTIVGLGLIGGSLAAALKKSAGVGEVMGIDIDPQAIQFALDNNIIDRGSTDVSDLSKDADIVVIAIYVGGIAECIKSILPHVGAETILTDTGSVKGDIVKDASAVTGKNLQFVGGHPIAGTENSGVEFADPQLFEGRRCILTPVADTHKMALNRVTTMWETVGCSVYRMDPELHDRIFGIVSHLPHVVAYALVNSVLDSDDSETLVEFAGGGLRDYTRVAASSPEMWAQIFMANREMVLKAIGSFKNSVESIEEALKSDDRERLARELGKASGFKRNL